MNLTISQPLSHIYDSMYLQENNIRWFLFPRILAGQDSCSRWSLFSNSWKCKFFIFDRYNQFALEWSMAHKHNQKDSIQISEEDYSALECPVCYSIIITTENIYQCENGHITCQDCYSKLPSKRCPECRMNLFKTRHLKFACNIFAKLK